jgi:hypothetical protein
MPNILIPANIRAKLLANGAKSADGEYIDPIPVVKLFTHDANATWLITELDPENPNIGFGLADLGLGSPELGSFSLQEIANVRGSLGLPVERDRHFIEKRPISVIATLARRAGRIA